MINDLMGSGIDMRQLGIAGVFSLAETCLCYKQAEGPLDPGLPSEKKTKTPSRKEGGWEVKS